MSESQELKKALIAQTANFISAHIVYFLCYTVYMVITAGLSFSVDVEQYSNFIVLLYKLGLCSDNKKLMS